MQTQQISQWKGSLNTAEHVRQEIALRWGNEEAEKYNPLDQLLHVSCLAGKRLHRQERRDSYPFLHTQGSNRRGERKAGQKAVF